MNDNLENDFLGFEKIRTAGLHSRFPGMYRSVVVDTNDPLNMFRVKFKCPELHDADMSDEDCPWAVPSPILGGFRSKDWKHPCIGDHVWIEFEKDHPYGPVWTGAADATRRKLYVYPSIHQRTPLPVDENGKPAQRPNDYQEQYLPKDGRPMSIGLQDRYGSADIINSVGYFPSTHDKLPPIDEYDAIQKSEFKQLSNKPLVNDPDTKYMARISKYGHMFIMGDQGYHWNNKDGGVGEFSGDFVKDEQFEISRWFYIQNLINENKPKDNDQRHLLLLSRYGHKIEARDTGWAQKGPIESKTRPGEYADPTIISNESEKDLRYIKVRTKGGMLFQMYDKGFHPNDDNYVKRLLIDETADKTEKEIDYWGDRDARWIRLVSRHGLKFVIDDRGSHETASEEEELPRPNGIMLKGRRSPGAQGMPTSGDPKGFFIEFNENDDINQLTCGSPVGQIYQINDKLQYMVLATRRGDYPRPWRGIQENEFLHQPVINNDLEAKSHHLKLDLHNEYIRLKSRNGSGDDPIGSPVNPPAILGPLNQGLEIRDGTKGDDPWVEMVDSQERNLWMWGKGSLVMCHARRQPTPVNLMWWFDEVGKKLVIHHDEVTGKIQIYATSGIEIISKSKIFINATDDLTLKSDSRVVISGGGSRTEWGRDGIYNNIDHHGPAFVQPGKNINIDQDPIPEKAPKLGPSNRGARYNNELEAPADINEVEHKNDN